MNNSQKYLLLVPTGLLVMLGTFCISLLILSDSKPKVIVYLDKDTEQPAMLPLPEDTIIKGDRAALWWSVFNKSLDAGAGAINSKNVANQAVLTVYGEIK